MPFFNPASPARNFAIRNLSFFIFLTIIFTSFLTRAAFAATLTGTVVDAADGATPVHPVAIDLMDIATGESVLGVNNLPNGTYEFTDVAPGDYILFFNAFDSADGYIDELFDEIVPCSNGACDRVTLSTHVTIVDGANVQDEALDAGAVINGTVTAAGSGTPLQDVSVEFYNLAGNFLYGTQTGPDGTFTSGGLPPQPMYVVANGAVAGYATEIYNDVVCPEGDCFIVAPSATQLNPGAGASAVADFDLESTTTATIEGRVTGSDTLLPVGGIVLSLFDLQCNYVTGASTNVNGDYQIALDGPGDFYLFAVVNDTVFGNEQSIYMNQQYPGINIFDSCYPELNDLSLGDVISVGQGQQVPGIDFVLEPGGEILGTISDSNGVLENGTAGARLYAEDGFQVALSFNKEADDSYRMGGILPGTYQLVMSSAGLGLIDERYDDIPCPRNSCDGGQGTEFVFTGTESFTGIDAVLGAGSVVRGTLTDANTTLPVANQCVFIYTSTGVYAAIACADENGNYETSSGLPAGDYRLSNQLFLSLFFDVDGGYVPQVWTNDGSFLACGNECDFLLGDTFTVDGTSALEGIDLAMVLKGSISGVISSSVTGQPVAEFEGRARLYQTDRTQVTTTLTDANGAYRFDGVPAGDYYVVLAPRYSNLIDELYDDIPCPRLSCDTAPGTVITVTDGASVTGVDATLDPGSLISGSVLADGEPVADGTILLYNDQGLYAGFGFVENGSYLTGSGMPAGDYYVTLEAAGIVNTAYPNRPCGSPCDPTVGELVTVDGVSERTGINFNIFANQASLSGTIVDAFDGNTPVHPVVIELYGTDGSSLGISTTNNPNGSYVLTGMAPGQYKVLFNAIETAATYADELYDEVSCSNGSCSIGFAGTSVDITLGANTLDEDLNPGGSISGVISSSVTGQPVAEFEGRARLYQTDRTQVTTTLTDANGAYRFDGVPAGDYYVVLAPRYSNLIDELYDDIPCPRLSCDTAPGTVITVTDGASVTGVDATLDPGSLISGSVLANGEPVADGTILLYNDQGLYAGFGFVENGSYLTGSGMPAGDYYVTLEAAGIVNTAYPNRPCGSPCDPTVGELVTVDGVSERTGINFNTTTGNPDSAVIFGRVADDFSGAPLSEVLICAVSQGDNAIENCAVTDAQGSYLIGNLPALSDYAVLTRDLGGQAFFGEVFDGQGCCNTAAATPVDITGGSAEINFSLASSGRIAGRITDSITGEGIPYLRIQVLDEFGNRVNAIESNTSDAPGLLGQYAVSGIPDGVHYVFVQGFTEGYVNEYYPNTQTIGGATVSLATIAQPIVIQGGTQVNGIDLALDPGGSISGAVSDVNGILPAFVARIRLYERGSRETLIQIINGNEDQTYTILGVPPGTYDVLLTSNFTDLVGERYDDEPCPRNSCDLDLGAAVVVGPQEHVTGVDAALDNGTVISGVLTDAQSGLGVGGFCAGIYTEDGIYAAFGCTDSEGNYVTRTGLPAGTYRAANFTVGISPDFGYLPQVWTSDGSFVSCGEPCDLLAGDTFVVDGGPGGPAIDLAMEQGSTISGNVQFGGNPVIGTDVVLLDDQGLDIQAVQTDGAGNYIFNGLGSGDYYVRTLNNLGYQDRLHAVPTDIVCDPDCNVFLATRIALGASSAVSGIDFTLTQAGSIAGTVTDGGFAPLSGVTVEAYNVLGNRVGSALSGPDGSYLIGGLGNGDHFVRTRNQLGYRNGLFDGLPCPANCQVLNGSPIAVSAGVTAANVDLMLDNGSTISGNIQGEGDSGSVPLAGTRVLIYSESGEIAAEAVADGKGDYRAEGLDEGNYHIITRTVSPIHVDQAADGSDCAKNCDPLSTPVVSLGAGQDLVQDFVLEIGAAFAAFVRDDLNSLPLGQVTLVVLDESGQEIKRGVSKASDGRAVIQGLPKTRVFLITENDLGYQDRVYGAVCAPSVCDPTEFGAVIDLARESVVSIALSGALEISGRVTDVENTQNPDFSYMLAWLYDQNGSVLDTDYIYPGTGAFSFDGLPSGSYRLRILPNHGNYVGAYIGQVYGGDSCSPTPCDINSGTEIILGNEDTSDIEVGLVRGNGIRANAFDPNGNQIREGVARLYGPGGEYLAATSFNFGFAAFGGLADGSYYVGFYPTGPSASLVPTVYEDLACPGLSCDVTAGTPIVLPVPTPPLQALTTGNNQLVVEPQIVSVTIEAERGYLISGSVKDSNNAAVRFAGVYFYNQDGSYAGEARTDGLGNFTSTNGLPNGTYYAATNRAGRPEDTPADATAAEAGVAGLGLANQVYNGETCNGICAPSGIGTPIVINGADQNAIDFVLSRAPGVSVKKQTNGVDADTANGGEAPLIAAGDTVNWTYEVTNTGGEPLVNILVVDDQGVTVSCPQTTLAPDASMTCTGSEPAADLSLDPFTGVLGNCAGEPDSRLYRNTATVTAETNVGVDVDDMDSSHYCNPQPREALIFGDGFEQR